jgi:hypothetical protein
MGKVEVKYTSQFADDLADLIFFIESKDMIATATKYADKVYDFIEKLNFDKVKFAYCKDPSRKQLGLKCIPYNKKYTIVLYQFEDLVIVTEFIPSKLIVY